MDSPEHTAEEKKILQALEDQGISRELLDVIMDMNEKEQKFVSEVSISLEDDFFHVLVIRLARRTIGNRAYVKLKNNIMAEMTARGSCRSFEDSKDSLLNIVSTTASGKSFFENLGMDKEKVEKGISMHVLHCIEAKEKSVFTTPEVEPEIA